MTLGDAYITLAILVTEHDPETWIEPKQTLDETQLQAVRIAMNALAEKVAHQGRRPKQNKPRRP